MNYDQLKSDLQDIVELAAEDLYAAYTDADGEHAETRAEAERRFEQEAVGGSFTNWAELYARRGAVLFVLRSLMLRVLADMNLWRPVRFKTDFSRDAFNRVAPHLGHKNYFRWIFRDAERAFPELFGASFVDLQTPSNETCRQLWELWRKRDADTGELVYEFDASNGITRFIGDLYQDLDEHVRDHYAMVQTPEFVEEFILDHTFEPALEEFGLEAGSRDKGEGIKDKESGGDDGTIKCIDPACGSGHFLVGLLRRLFAEFADAYPDREPLWWAERALDGVYGADINDYAAALARFRLLLETAALCEEHGQELTLEQLRELDGHVNVIATDSLIPWEDLNRGQQDLLQSPMEKLEADYGPPEVRERSSDFFAEGPFHVVVGNPPYITVKDEKKRDDYRAMYESCHRKYGLTAPFVERFVELGGGRDDAFAGYQGMIVGNNFMKRSFGTKLIEEFIPTWDLSMVVDTSGAYIPGHGTPTVMLFGRSREPASDEIRAVLGKRGEPEVPEEPENAKVWSSIDDFAEEVGHEDAWIDVQRLPREVLEEHPWSLEGGGKTKLNLRLDDSADSLLGDKSTSIGITAFTLADDLYVFARATGTSGREKFPEEDLRPMVLGEQLRDWLFQPRTSVVFPYDQELNPTEKLGTASLRYLWRGKPYIAGNKMFGGKTKVESGLEWFEYGRLTAHKLKTDLTITFAFVATHNHFVLDRGGKVFKQSAPVIKLPEEAGEAEHLWLCGLLNSSTACFWMKQTLHDKGGGGIGGGIASEKWEKFYEFTSTGLQDFPVVEAEQSQVTELARRLDAQADSLMEPGDVLDEAYAGELREMLEGARRGNASVKRQMVALQEELDWLAYRAYGLLDDPPLSEAAAAGEVELKSEYRPVAIQLARRVEAGELESSWFERHGLEPTTEIPAGEYPDDYVEVLEARLQLIEDEKFIRLLEQPAYKRRWNWDEWDKKVEEACESWLLERIEDLFDPDSGGPLAEPRPYSAERVADALRDDAMFLEVADLYVDGGVGDFTGLVRELLLQESVPDNPWRIFSTEGRNAGIDVYQQWKEVWNKQEEADRDANDGEFPGDQTGTHERTDISVPVPDKFKKANFAKIYTRVPYEAKTYTQGRVYGHRGRLNVPRERFIHFADVSEIMEEPMFGWAGWRDGDRAMAIYRGIEMCRTRAFYPVGEPTPEDPRMVGLALSLEDMLDDLRRWESEGMEREFRMLFKGYLGGAETVSQELLEAYLDKIVRPGKKDAFDPAEVHEADEDDAAEVPSDLLAEVRGHLAGYGDTGRTVRTLGRDFEGDWQPKQVRRALEVLYHQGEAERDGRGLQMKYWVES